MFAWTTNLLCWLYLFSSLREKEALVEVRKLMEEFIEYVEERNNEYEMKRENIE